MKAYLAISLAFASSALAAGGSDVVNQVLTQIASDLKEFDTAIKAFNGSDMSILLSSSKKIEQTTSAGSSQIAAGPELSLTDAVGITSNGQSLQTTLDSALSDLKGISEKLSSAGQCSTILEQLDSQIKAAQSLQNAITDKAPSETKSVAKQLGGAIAASLEDTNTFFKKACSGAGSGSAPAAPSPTSSASSGAPAASSPAKGEAGSKTSSTPNASQHTGASSSLSVPLFGALALALFAL